jgi:hypothetical protein
VLTCNCLLSSDSVQVDTALEVRSLQLSLAQFAHRFDVSGNGQTALLTLLGEFLRRCGVLHNESPAVHLPTVPLRAWQNRSDRLRAQLLSSDDLDNGGHFDGLRFYAMCPEPRCGKMHALDPLTRHLPLDAALRCNRKLISERTEWPLDCHYHGTPRPRWEVLVNNHEEPVCGQPLTLHYDPQTAAAGGEQSREPAIVFTYRSLRAGIRTVLARDGVQDRCEQWRQRAPPRAHAAAAQQRDEPVPMQMDSDDEKGAPPPPAAEAFEMTDVYDGQLWRDMHYWPPLHRQHEMQVPGWWEPHWQHRRAAAAAAGGAEAGSYAASYDGRLLAAPGTIALQLFLDWYQKHKQGGHSVGLIWACVLNLPREERYELHNMILVGLVPGPKHTSREQLQGVLQVVRDELMDLFRTPLQLHGRSHRVYLHMLVGDLQAVRPAMGFLTTAATYSCTMCDAKFKQAQQPQEPHEEESKQDAPADGAEQAEPKKKGSVRRDYRVATVDPRRQHSMQDAHHLRHARVWVNCPDLPAAAANIDKQRRSAEAYEAAMQNDGKLNAVSGVWEKLLPRWRRWLQGTATFDAAYIEQKLTRELSFRSRAVNCWSALRDLPYFDTVRASPIDVMHNILLGVCKQIIRVATGHKSDPALAAASAAAPGKQAADSASSTGAAAAAAGGLSTFGGGGVAFGEHEMRELQQFMDRSVPPRDVGRIRERLESLSHVKAVEWLNWVTMQAVPAVRTLVYQRAVVQEGERRKLFPVHGMHLRLFSQLQQLVEELCKYSTSAQAIRHIDTLLRDLMQTFADTFHAAGPSVCTPNMHLALHLPAQLRDFGPVQGWWCFPYERLMGVASKLPSKPGTASIDVARRLLATLHLANASLRQKSQQEADPHPSLIFGFDHTLLPVARGAGFRQAYARSANSALRHIFSYTDDAAGVAAAASVRGWRSGQQEAEGWEPFPAVCFNSGSTLKMRVISHAAPAAAAHAEAPVALLQLVRTRCMLSRDFDTCMLQQPGASGWPRLRADQRPPGRGLVPLQHVQRCLLAWHLKTHRNEVLQHYHREIASLQAEIVRQRDLALQAVTAAGPPPASRQAQQKHAAHIRAAVASAIEPFQTTVAQLQREQEKLGRLLLPEDAASEWQQLQPVIEHMMQLMLSAHGDDGPSQRARRGQKRPRASDSYATALAWYEQQVDPAHAGAQIDIFDKLLHCGEETASDIATSRTGANSYIFVLRPRAEDRWYGRVSYYIRHRFKGRCYHFAAARWYARATPQELESLWPNYAAVHAEVHAADLSPAAVARATEHQMRARECAATFTRWPVLRWKYCAATLTDLIPVHHIAGRWMPSLPNTPSQTLLQYACPLRARMLHGS